MKAVFIVGTGRSGTHFTCRAMAGFSNVFDPLSGKETKSLLKSIAISAIQHKQLDSKVINYYTKVFQDLPNDKVLVDQHHPNMFFVEDLSKLFDGSVFLYPQRPTLQIVASMLNHRGVLSWYSYSKNRNIFGTLQPTIPIPNRFLGLTSAQDLFQLELHKLCALRVLAHRKHMENMVRENPACRFIEYEELVKDQMAIFQATFSEAELASLGKFSVVEKGKPSSLDKYKTVLTKKQIEDILELEELSKTIPLS